MPHIRNNSCEKVVSLLVGQLARNIADIQEWGQCEGHRAEDEGLEHASIGTTVYCDGTCRDAGDDPERLTYLNAYELSREYGGPEEGGWYYDAGYPVASIRVHSQRDVRIAAKALYLMWHLAVDGDREYTSVLGGTDIVIQLGTEEAKEFPAERPMYC